MKKHVLFLLIAGITISTTAKAQKFISTNGEDIEMSKNNTTDELENKTRIFETSEDVPQGWEKIGILTIEEEDYGKALKSAKKYASRATGDGILLIKDESDKGGTNINTNVSAYRKKKKDYKREQKYSEKYKQESNEKRFYVYRNSTVQRALPPKPEKKGVMGILKK